MRINTALYGAGQDVKRGDATRPLLQCRRSAPATIKAWGIPGGADESSDKREGESPSLCPHSSVGIAAALYAAGRRFKSMLGLHDP